MSNKLKDFVISAVAANFRNEEVPWDKLVEEHLKNTPVEEILSNWKKLKCSSYGEEMTKLERLKLEVDKFVEKVELLYHSETMGEEEREVLSSIFNRFVSQYKPVQTEDARERTINVLKDIDPSLAGRSLTVKNVPHFRRALKKISGNYVFESYKQKEQLSADDYMSLREAEIGILIDVTARCFTVIKNRYGTCLETMPLYLLEEFYLHPDKQWN